MTTAKIGVALWGGLYAAEQLPLPEPLDQFAKYGSTGIAFFLVWWMLAKTIPSINKANAESNDKLAEKIDELKDELKTSSDRQCTLLEAALVRTYKQNNP
jgi:hypothetical protein